MATNGSVNRTRIQGNERLCRVLASLVALTCSMGKTLAEVPDEYRESLGNVAEFTVELTDPALMITWFVRLQDGSVIRPRIYYCTF